jgi:putative transposase
MWTPDGDERHEPLLASGRCQDQAQCDINLSSSPYLEHYLLVDTLGLLLSVEVTPANTSDQAGARRLLIGLTPLQPRLELIWADGSYSGAPLATWCAAEGAWRVEIIKPTPHVKGFVVRPWCWIVERTLGWLGRQRRLSKDYERKLQTSETLLKLAMIRLMVRRLARSSV